MTDLQLLSGRGITSLRPRHFLRIGHKRHNYKPKSAMDFDNVYLFPQDELSLEKKIIPYEGNNAIESSIENSLSEIEIIQNICLSFLIVIISVVFYRA